MPVTLPDNSVHNKTTREAKWTPVRDNFFGEAKLVSNGPKFSNATAL